jgi:hypothetical protein
VKNLFLTLETRMLRFAQPDKNENDKVSPTR